MYMKIKVSFMFEIELHMYIKLSMFVLIGKILQLSK